MIASYLASDPESVPTRSPKLESEIATTTPHPWSQQSSKVRKYLTKETMILNLGCSPTTVGATKNWPLHPCRSDHRTEMGKHQRDQKPGCHNQTSQDSWKERRVSCWITWIYIEDDKAKQLTTLLHCYTFTRTYHFAIPKRTWGLPPPCHFDLDIRE